jgi:hypothetical protein
VETTKRSGHLTAKIFAYCWELKKQKQN